MSPISLREALAKVLSEYERAKAEQFASHPLASFIRDDLETAVSSMVEDKVRFKVSASPGQGNWAAVPWCAVLDVLITNSAQSGYYPVYLFRADLSGVYLSLNQGVTEIREKYKGETTAALRTRADDFRLQLGGLPASFPEREIFLNLPGKSIASDYESGNVCAVFYSSNSLPTDRELEDDLRHMLGLYGTLSFNETIPIGSGAKEADERADFGIEDLRRMRQHKRIERNASLARTVKQVQGTTCRVCQMRFVEVYGSIGADFIEAHHLVPLHLLKGEVIQLDPARDFAVLCPNCHAMIHRTDQPGDIPGFVQNHFLGLNRAAKH